ncbi:MAG: LysM peptidoglycan-binding domain-containing protein [Deltaproteobacteria bacterium]|nr:MAG: LysM peptidoglycan-binding domain-containing protein [Deltaproteobacteria bacterium]
MRKQLFFMGKWMFFLWMGLIAQFMVSGLVREVSATEYRVRGGDSLTRISKKFGVPTRALMETNGLTGIALKPGQRLIVPENGTKPTAQSKKTTAKKPSSYTVQGGDTLATIATRTGISVNDIKKWNRVQPKSLKIGQKLTLAGPGAVKKEPALLEDGESDPLEELGETPDETGEDLRSEAQVAEGDGNRDCGSDCLGKWNSAGERLLLVRVAKGFLDAPYRWGGSSVRGLDCSAFAKKIYGFFDIDLPRTAREQAQVGKYVPRNGLKEGDLVFFNTRRAFGHVGIYIGNNKFVHASSGQEKKVRIDTLETPFYNKRFVRAVRIKEIDGEI